MFDALLDQIAQVRARVASKPDFRWGVVTGTAPLTVRLDADEDPLDGSPSTLVTGLGVGDRVMVMIQHHRATVTGVAKGSIIPAASETTQGVVELATQAEVSAGADTTRAVTPAAMRGVDYRAYAEAAGSIASVAVVSAGQAAATVTLPAGRFSVAPIVICGMLDGAREGSAWPQSITASSFTLYLGNTSPVTRNIASFWHAIQMTSATAAG